MIHLMSPPYGITFSVLLEKIWLLVFFFTYLFSLTKTFLALLCDNIFSFYLSSFYIMICSWFEVCNGDFIIIYLQWRSVKMILWNSFREFVGFISQVQLGHWFLFQKVCFFILMQLIKNKSFFVEMFCNSLWKPTLDLPKQETETKKLCRMSDLDPSYDPELFYLVLVVLHFFSYEFMTLLFVFP